ncbi:hypothetical protein [Halobacterium hubeiense]|uniref:hypothetical protein n=1 Tax=Halobacterium hubeiense TaxID=1407499 RepID=UPI003C78E3B8
MNDSEDWEQDVVEPVLRVLHQAGVAVTADVVATNLDAVLDDAPSAAEVDAALAELVEDNLVRPFADADGYYVITDRGSGHVGNELDEEGFGFVD